MAIVDLDRTPGTGTLYGRAALSPLRRSRPAALPELTLRRRGIRVDPGHLAGYRGVCGLEPAATLPATYPYVLGFPLAMSLMSRPDFPVPVPGLVHLVQRVSLLGPLPAGEPLDLTVSATDLRPHRRGLAFDVVTTAGHGDSVAWRGVATYLARRVGGPADAPAIDEGLAAPSGAADGRTAAEAGPGAPAATEAGPGAGSGRPGGGWPGGGRIGPSALWTLPADLGRRYARVSGDRNPIHTSRAGARLFGVRGPIAHGMWTAARCLGELGGRLPGRFRFDVSFRRPVPLPATVAFTAVPGRFAARGDAASGWRLAVSDPGSGAVYLRAGLLPARPPAG